MHCEFYRDKDDDWRWRLRANGRIVAESGEGYSSKGNCRRAWRTLALRLHAGALHIEVLEV